MTQPQHRYDPVGSDLYAESGLLHAAASLADVLQRVGKHPTIAA